MMFIALACLVLLLSVARSEASKFEVTEGNIGDLKTMKIANTDTKEYVEVVIDFGGRVEELHLKSQKDHNIRNVLLSHNGDSEAIKENTWSKGMLLLPWANRINEGKYDFFNGSYSLPTNDPPRNNALHGFMAGKKLFVLSKHNGDTSGSFVALLRLRDEQGYPFKLDIFVFYTLNEDGFSIRVNATNFNGNGKPLPFFMGWHPYFKCTSYTSVVAFDDHTHWNHVQLNANLDPTGITEKTQLFDGKSPIGGNKTNPTFYDDEFKSLGSGLGFKVAHTKLYATDTEQTVVLWQDEFFNFVHVFTGNVEGIAIEPMSGMADAYNNHDGLAVISDGETWSGSFGIYVE